MVKSFFDVTPNTTFRSQSMQLLDSNHFKNVNIVKDKQPNDDKIEEVFNDIVDLKNDEY